MSEKNSIPDAIYSHCMGKTHNKEIWNIESNGRSLSPSLSLLFEDLYKKQNINSTWVVKVRRVKFNSKPNPNNCGSQWGRGCGSGCGWGSGIHRAPATTAATISPKTEGGRAGDLTREGNCKTSKPKTSPRHQKACKAKVATRHNELRTDQPSTSILCANNHKFRNTTADHRGSWVIHIMGYDIQYNKIGLILSFTLNHA